MTSVAPSKGHGGDSWAAQHCCVGLVVGIGRRCTNQERLYAMYVVCEDARKHKVK
jgi:hypothetical protein